MPLIREAPVCPCIYNRNRLLSIGDCGYGGSLTELPIAVTANRMGRPPLNVKPTMVRLAESVRLRIIALVGPNRMAEFIREAVERELTRREKAHNSRPKPPGDV